MNHLLPNSVSGPGFPRHIGLETGRKWLHELRFKVLNKKKGVGHNVMQHRQQFLRQLVAGGFLSREDAPTDEAESAIPDDIDSS